METHFATPERQDQEIVGVMSTSLRAQPMSSWFDALPVSILVLNQDRQIVYFNKAFHELSRRIDPGEIVGLRPGEALGCVNAKLMEGGCGCSELCSVCGAAIAILSSLRGEDDCQECNLVRIENGGESVLDLQVFTRPVEFEGRNLSLFTAMDISHEKRLSYMERKFFHDMVNAAGGMAQLASLSEEDAESRDEYMEIMGDCSRHILQEVLFLRDVTAAEIGRLSAHYQKVFLPALVQEVVGDYADRPESRRVQADTAGVAGEIVTDPRLLRHVLGCIYLNALEAGEGTATVTIESRENRKFMEVKVANPGRMPENIRKQLFKRYVSTKDRSRGLGLYVARMLARQYLRGDVRHDYEGGMTTFTVSLPLDLAPGWVESRRK